MGRGQSRRVRAGTKTRLGMKISIDTNILIWGVRQIADVGQEEMIPRATAFIEWIDRQGHTLVLTSQSVAEFLVGGSEAERAAQFHALGTHFQICPFDTLAARIAADIRSDKDFVDSLHRDGKTRACIKADIAIVATAKAHDVDKIFSNDAKLRSAAKKCGLPAADIPTLQELTTVEAVSPPSRTRELFPEEEAPKNTPPATAKRTLQLRRPRKSTGTEPSP